jgi:hypothetical protein
MQGVQWRFLGGASDFLFPILFSFLFFYDTPI